MFSSNKKMMIAQIIINGPFIVMPMLVGLLLIFLSFEKMAVSMILMSTLGLLLITLAKWSVLKQGRFFSFGPKDMNKRARCLYYLGYIFIFLSCVGTWWLLAYPSFYGMK